MELSLPVPRVYRMKRGQTLRSVALAFGLPPALLAARNGLTKDPGEGTVLLIPQERGDLYTVKGGESATLLCGSPARFFERNGTRALYPGQTVLL